LAGEGRNPKLFTTPGIEKSSSWLFNKTPVVDKIFDPHARFI